MDILQGRFEGKLHGLWDTICTLGSFVYLGLLAYS